MFSKIALFFAAFMAVFVVALPSPGTPGVTNSCNSGTTYCCNSVEKANSEATQKKLGILSALIPAAANVGFTCSPVSIAAIAGNSCTTQAACCTGNKFSGGVVVGCSPINANT